MDHPEALQLLKDAGCIVNEHQCEFRAGWLMNIIRLAPSEIVVANRKGQRVMPLEKNRTYFGTGSDSTLTVDLETGARRCSMKKDVELAPGFVDWKA